MTKISKKNAVEKDPQLSGHATKKWLDLKN